MAASYDLPFPHPRHCPTKSEVLFSKELINSLDEEIQNVQKRLKELEIRLQHLQRTKANHLSYISPFRCLPPEIIGCIVQVFVINWVELFTLTQICGTTREIVTGLSPIWSKIELCGAEAYDFVHLVRHGAQDIIEC
jgi:hypothetical protein